MSRDDLLRAISQYDWAHSIDLGDGIVTPGMCGPANPHMVAAFNQIDFCGKTVLDIGCWDGLWSFEAETMTCGPSGQPARRTRAASWSGEKPDPQPACRLRTSIGGIGAAVCDDSPGGVQERSGV
jgi:tRNA (mo5U34)-methyltransferase